MSNTEDYRDGRAHGENAVHQFGLRQAEAMVDYLMELDNKALYGLAFARSVSEIRIERMTH